MDFTNVPNQNNVQAPIAPATPAPQAPQIPVSTPTGKITTNMLQKGDTFRVRGKVTFARVSSMIEGQELASRIEHARQMQAKGINIFPVETPHRTITIEDAYVDYANPSAPTLAEQYAASKIFTSSNGKSTYTAVSKSNRPVPISSVVNGELQGEEIIPGREPAKGLDVTLWFSVYTTRRNNGVGLDGIIVNEPMRWYNGQSKMDQIAQQMNLNGYTPAPQTYVAPQQAQPVQQVPSFDQIINGAPAVQPANPMMNAQTCVAPQQAQPMAQPFGTPVQAAQPFVQQTQVAQPFGAQTQPMAQPFGVQAAPAGTPFAQQAQAEMAQTAQLQPFGNVPADNAPNPGTQAPTWDPTAGFPS